MADEKAISYLVQTFHAFLEGREVSFSNIPFYNSIENNELKELFDLVETSFGVYNEGIRAIKKISDGDLNFDMTVDSPALKPIKTLNSKLTRLVQQTQLIAEGDYTQHIDFIGDFSVSFNQLINSLEKQRELEREFIESQKKYRLIAENSNDVIWTIDILTQRITFISPSIFNLCGFTVEEIIKNGFKSILLPESVEKEVNYYALLRSKIEKGEPLPIENGRYQLQRKDGRIADIETYTNIIYDENGNPKEILGISRDISERIETERALIESEKQLARLLYQASSENSHLIKQLQYLYSHADNAIAFFDIEGESIRFSSCNKRWANSLNFSPEELKCFDIDQLPEKETSALYRLYILKAVADKRPIEEYVFWHNMHLHVIVIPILEEKTNVVMSCASLVYDISEKFEAEKKIRETEGLFMSIFNNSNDAIVLLTMQLEIVDVNKEFYRLHGSTDCSRQNVLEAYFLSEYHKLIANQLHDIQKGISIPPIECELFRYDKNVVPVEISTSVITLKGDSMLLCIIRDISMRKEMEQMLVKVGTQIELRERKRLAADLHDNVGPLLSSMNMYLSVLLRKDQLHPYVEIMNDIRRILKDTISSVREISNNLNPQLLQSYGLTAALDHFFETKKKLININVNNTIGNSRFLEMKEIMIYNIIKESFNNSIKHADADTINIDIHEKDNLLSVEYSDNGIGFDFEEKLKNIDTSMGVLSIINRVKMLKGNYSIETSPGNGFLMKIDFPVK